MSNILVVSVVDLTHIICSRNGLINPTVRKVPNAWVEKITNI